MMLGPSELNRLLYVRPEKVICKAILSLNCRNERDLSILGSLSILSEHLHLRTLTNAVAFAGPTRAGDRRVNQG